MEETGFSIDSEVVINTSGNGLIEKEGTLYKLKAFRVIGFKAFQDSGWIELNRITLLLGENSAGKSALYQVLSLLKIAYDGLLQEKRFTNLAALEDYVGDFDAICNKQSEKKEIKICFRFQHVAETLEYSVCLVESKEHKFGRVSKVSCKIQHIEWDLLAFYQSLNLFFLEAKENVKVPQNVRNLVANIMTSLRIFVKTFQTMGAHRVRPTRLMQLSGGMAEAVGYDGYNAYEMLYAMAELQNKPTEMVNNWLAKFGYSYRWNMVGMNRGEFLLKDLKTNVESNIVDNGFGISQSLPLVLMMEELKDGMILVDSPEAFLQTDMQSEMGDCLVDGTSRGRVLVETGSEYLTLRIRRRIAEGLIRCEEVSVYFVEENEGGNTICHPILLTEYGEFANTTEKFRAFFSSDYEDMEQIDTLRRERYRRQQRNVSEHSD